MLQFNKAMDLRYRKLDINRFSLAESLKKLASEGFTQVDNFVFLKHYYKANTNVNAESFPDATGYECFINSIHIDDYVSCDYLAQAVLFSRSLFQSFNDLELKSSLVCVMSMDELGLNIKFYLARINESYLNNDLNGYDEAVLIVDSNEPGWRLSERNPPISILLKEESR
jgi:hypothetical protein